MDDAEPAVPADLLDLSAADGFEAYDAALAEQRGTVAVVGPPFSGRETVLDSAADRTGAEQVSLGPGATPPTLPDADDGALAVAGCQHLHQRHVGGFDPLTAFLDALARTDVLVVTGWNSHAWSYLDLAADVSAAFDTVLHVPDVPAEALAEFVRTHGPDPRIVAKDTERQPPVRRGTATFTVAGREVSVPYPRPNPDYLTSLRTDQTDPESAAVQRLASVADGNPGVALAVWRACVDAAGGEELTPADVADPVDTPDLTDPEVFLLRLVLTSERMATDWLDAVADLDPERALRRLDRADLLDRENDVVELRPEAVPTAVELTERRRLP